MIMVDKFFQELENYCLQGDFTEQEKLLKYAKEYTTRCANFNESCDRLQEFLDKGLVNEAKQLYLQITPPLEEQFNGLQFGCVMDFISCLGIYGFEPPPTISSSVIDRLKKEFRQSKELKPLIDKYRYIAKSDKIAEKLDLARQIMSISPDKGVWLKTVRDLENEMIHDISPRIKPALDNHNTLYLQNAIRTLTDDAWVNPPPQELIDMVRSYIEQDRLYRLNIIAEKQANHIDELYREDPVGQHDALYSALEAWDKLLKTDNFTPKQELVALVELARESWKLIEKEKNDERTYQSLIFEISNGIRNQSLSLNELDNLSFKVSQLSRSIPPELQQLVQAYRESCLLKLKKKKLLKNVMILFMVLLILAASFFAFVKYTEHKLVLEYSRKLTESISDNSLLAEKSEAIFAEIEKKYPQLLVKEKFRYLRAKLTEKKEFQNKNSKRFEIVFLEVQENLKSYKVNQDSLKKGLEELAALQFTDDQRARYSDVLSKYEEAKKNYIDAQDNAYLGELNRLYNLYHDVEMLLDSNDSAEAQKKADEIDKGIRKLKGIQDVTEKIRMDSQPKLAKLQTIRQRINQFNIDQTFSSALDSWVKRYEILDSAFPPDSELGINEDTYSRWEKLKGITVKPSWFDGVSFDNAPSRLDASSVESFINRLEKDWNGLKANEDASTSLKLKRANHQEQFDNLDGIRNNIKAYLSSLDSSGCMMLTKNDSDRWEEEIRSFINLIPDCDASVAFKDLLDNELGKQKSFDYTSFFPLEKNKLDELRRIQEALKNNLKEYVSLRASEAQKNPLYSIAYTPRVNTATENFFEFYYDDSCLSQLSTTEFRGENSKTIPVLPDKNFKLIILPPSISNKEYSSKGFVFKNISKSKMFTDPTTNSQDLKNKVPHQTWAIKTLSFLNNLKKYSSFDALTLLQNDLCTTKGKNGSFVYKRDAYMRVKIIYDVAQSLKETMRKEKRNLQNIEGEIDKEIDNLNEILYILKEVIEELPDSFKKSWMEASYTKPDSYFILVDSLKKIQPSLSMKFDEEISKYEEFFDAIPKPCGVLRVYYENNYAPPALSFIPMPDKKDSISGKLLVIDLNRSLMEVGYKLSLKPNINVKSLVKDRKTKYLLVFSVLD